MRELFGGHVPEQHEPGELRGLSFGPVPGADRRIGLYIVRRGPVPAELGERELHALRGGDDLASDRFSRLDGVRE